MSVFGEVTNPSGSAITVSATGSPTALNVGTTRGGIASTPAAALYSVSGTNMTSAIVVTPSSTTNFEVSLDNVTYGSSVTTAAPDGSGNIASTPIYVRLTGAGTGTLTGTLSNADVSGTATTRSVAITGTISTPVISLNGGTSSITLSAFTTVQGTPSTDQPYTVSGSNLNGTDGIDVTPPSGYELSISGGSYSAALQTIAQTSAGAVSSTTVNVRLIGTTLGTYGTSGTPLTISHVTTNGVGKTVSVFGSVTTNAPAIGQATVSGAPVCAIADASVTVSYTPTGTFDTPNTFSAELSTSTGAFPGTTLSTTASTASSLTVTIPAGTAYGTGYKIRVNGSNNGATVNGTASTAFTIVTPTVTVGGASTQTILTSATTGTAITVAETPAASSRQWYYTSTTNTTPTAISGATGTSYTPKGADFGAAADTYTITVKSTYGTPCSTTITGTGSATVQVNNPNPGSITLNPATGFVGTAFSLTITGTGFNASSTATFGGRNITPTAFTATSLTVPVLATDVPTATTYSVTVTNPTPGGGTTTAATYTATNAPCVSSDFESTPTIPATWDYSGVTTSASGGVSGSKAVIFSGASHYLTTTPAAYPNSLSFYISRTSSTTARNFYVKASTTSQAGPFTTVASYTVSDMTTSNVKKTVNLSAYATESTVWIRFERGTESTSAQTLIDEVAITCDNAPTPGTITVSTNSPLNAGSTQQLTASTPPVSYTVSGSSLGVIPIKIQAPTGFQVSTDAAFTGITADANLLSLTPSSGSVASTPIYVRLSGTGSAGTISGSIVHSSGTSTAQNVVVYGTLTAAPQEINIKQSTTDLATGGSYAFADTKVGSRTTATFTIENLGGTALTLSSFLTTAGTAFTAVGTLPTTVPAFSTVTFGVAFDPTTVGALTGSISIVSNDSDENPYLLNFTGNGTAATYVTWTGGAGDGNFASAANWSTNSVPGSTADVLLDHSTVSTSYVVTLSAATTLKSLTIKPSASGQTIELQYSGTGAINLGTAGQTALAIYDRGIFTNSSTGTISTTGTGYLYNGGTYRHATAASASTLTTSLTAGAGPGTEAGNFIFDVGVNHTPALINKTFGNLTLRGGAAYGGSGASGPLVILGTLTVDAGTTFNPAIKEIDLGGNLVANGTISLTSTNANSLLLLNGTSPQTITAAGGITLSSYFTVEVNNPTGVTLASPMTVNGTLKLTNGNLTTTSTNLLEVPSTATITGGSSSSLVNGPMTRTIAPVSSATSYLFPIGKDVAYRPLTLNVSTQTSTTQYLVEQQEGRPWNFSSSMTDPTPVVRLSRVRTFTITPVGGQPTGFSGTVTMSFGSDDGVNAPGDAGFVLAKRADNVSPWSNIGKSTYTGTGTGRGGVPVSGTVTSASFTSFSEFALAATTTNDGFTETLNPLPVSLTSFTAGRQAAGVQLRWTTASELNNAYFEVQRSTDAKNFVLVTKVEGHATTNQAQLYTSFDAAAPAQTVYYRLRQVDFDGKAVFSPVVTVAGTKAAAVLTLYPNPTHDLLTVPGAAGQVVEVLDLSGRVQLKATLSEAAQLRVQQLPAGSYLLRLKQGERTVVGRFVKN